MGATCVRHNIIPASVAVRMVLTTGDNKVMVVVANYKTHDRKKRDRSRCFPALLTSVSKEKGSLPGRDISKFSVPIG
jgi:hypothetical protein